MINNTSDFLIANLEQEIEEGMTVVQGTSAFIPLIATKLAQTKKKINLIGGFALNPDIDAKIPSTFSSYNFPDSKSYLGLSGFLDMLQNRKIDLEFLRPAQMDQSGVMNNTIIGNYKTPKIRLPGGMGVEDVMTFVKKIILYIPNHNKKVFVKKVDFVTAHGWNRGKGPDKIITNMCIFEFPDKRITLTAINPEYTLEDVKKETGFKFAVAKEIRKMAVPDEETIKLIEKADPLRLRDLEIKEKREEVLKKFR
ncbi:MAG TPA: CoA-transferase [Candidatus Omnitrophota bacterium]|nr:CoA-transferase [Candidatus Omnitrophota bacterium]